MEKIISKGKRKRRRPGFTTLTNDDFISKLPDSLLCQILSYLSTKDIVKTSSLSKRWVSLWLMIPGLDLDSSEFQDFTSFKGFIDRFLDNVREAKSCLQKLKLSITKDEDDTSCVTRWVDYAVKGKVKHLDVDCGGGVFMHRACLEVMPLSLYICKTLVYLRLVGVVLSSFESVSLPRVKTMCLEYNVYGSDTALELLISSCLVLEDLSIVRRMGDKLMVLRVHSQSLTSFSLDLAFGEDWRELSRRDRGNSELLIDAPRLKYLCLSDEVSKSKIINNLGSLAKVNFDGCFDIQYHFDGTGLSKNQMARNFFTGISRVEDMIISENSWKFFPSYLAVEPLPQFCNLSRLETVLLYSSDVNILSTILESCPNLKSIVLLVDCTGLEFFTHSTTLPSPISVSPVPQCLLSSLEFVEIKNIFEGRCVETQVARYFLENSLVLKKLLVHLSEFMRKESLVVLRSLLALPRPSTMCEIYVDDDDC